VRSMDGSIFSWQWTLLEAKQAKVLSIVSTTWTVRVGASRCKYPAARLEQGKVKDKPLGRRTHSLSKPYPRKVGLQASHWA